VQIERKPSDREIVHGERRAMKRPSNQGQVLPLATGASTVRTLSSFQAFAV